MKQYKLTYKPFFNERLKQVSFHGELTYPLYIQITHKRKTTFFKSYYFELLSKSKYSKRSKSGDKGPTIQQVIEKEIALIDYIIVKLSDNPSLENFRGHYDFYCRDLCTETEAGFRVYMFLFFSERNMSALGKTLARGGESNILYDVLMDMKNSFNQDMYDELLKEAVIHNQPYLQLYSFVKKVQKWPMLLLTIQDWESGIIKNRFEKFLLENYKAQEATALKNGVDYWVKLLARSTV